MQAKMALVAVCRRCKHRPVLYPANLISRFGEECPAIELRERLDPACHRLYAPKRVTNTCNDKAITEFWKDSFEKRRCLVPASAFCEPDEGKPARWHWFALKDGADPRPPFAFAGIYRTWKGPIKKDGPNVDLEVFSFMTTLPNTLTQTINHERSPVLLTDEDQRSTWLTGSPEDAFGLIRTSDPTMMQIVQSGFEKKDLPAAA
jgi:putative SOS response-associated peptidase YedK